MVEYFNNVAIVRRVETKLCSNCVYFVICCIVRAYGKVGIIHCRTTFRVRCGVAEKLSSQFATQAANFLISCKPTGGNIVPVLVNGCKARNIFLSIIKFFYKFFDGTFCGRCILVHLKCDWCPKWNLGNIERYSSITMFWGWKLCSVAENQITPIHTYRWVVTNFRTHWSCYPLNYLKPLLTFCWWVFSRAIQYCLPFCSISRDLNKISFAVISEVCIVVFFSNLLWCCKSHQCQYVPRTAIRTWDTVPILTFVHHNTNSPRSFVSGDEAVAYWVIVHKDICTWIINTIDNLSEGIIIYIIVNSYCTLPFSDKEITQPGGETCKRTFKISIC